MYRAQGKDNFGLRISGSHPQRVKADYEVVQEPAVLISFPEEFDLGSRSEKASRVDPVQPWKSSTTWSQLPTNL